MAAVVSSPAFGRFVEPREGPVAFRRDRLPVDVETMESLSEALTTLAKAKGREEDRAEMRRAKAQMLALALALNPENERAERAIGILSRGERLEEVPVREIRLAQARLWRVRTWLQAREKISDGQALAAYLGDILRLSDADDPRAIALGKEGEQGQWQGWIAGKNAFEDIQVVPEEEVKGNQAEMPVVLPAEIRLAEAVLSTPLWQYDPEVGQDVLRLSEVRMKAAIVEAGEGEEVVPPLTFAIDHTETNGQVARMNRLILAMLKKQFGDLPTDARVSFSLPGEYGYLFRKDRHALSGAAAVLMGAAISGKAPTGVVIGEVEASGAFRAGADFWERLRALADGPGGRLVIPREAAGMLPAILTLEDPGFFLRYDVLYALNFEELLARTSAEAGEPLAGQLVRFREIREKSTGIPVGQYVANRFVRQRLVELAAEADDFASVKLLLMQAGGERVPRLPRKIAAMEVRRAAGPLDWLVGMTAAEMDVGRLERSSETVRGGVEGLEKYLDSGDVDLLALPRELLSAARAYSRASRIGANRDDGPANIAKAFAALKKAHVALVAGLREVTGAPDGEDEAE